MRRSRMVFFALLFIALAVLRLGVPAWPRAVREFLWALVDSGENYTIAVETMGRQLAPEGLYAGLSAVWEYFEDGEQAGADKPEAAAIPAEVQEDMAEEAEPAAVQGVSA